MRAALALVVFSVAAPASAQPPVLAELLDTAGRYVRGFEQDFQTVISDETYVQRERQTRTVNGRTRQTSTVRTIGSETLFMWVKEEQTWLMVRNVLRVDGRAVPDSRARLERAIADVGSQGPEASATGSASLPARPLGFEPLANRFRRLRDESARFNLGAIHRNLNDPMLPFQFVDPAFRPRFSFAISGEESVNGVSTWKLTFAEHTAPTVVTVDGRDSLANGAIWITASGVVLRTQLDLTNPATSLTSSIAVTYGRDPKLAGWVPMRMEETYTQRPSSAGAGHGIDISCVATYSNFRRFVTSGRVVVPR